MVVRRFACGFGILFVEHLTTPCVYPTMIGVVLVESSTDITFGGCLFANTTTDGHGGGMVG